MRGSTRRFRAVLFLDVVGSTTIAAELGDDGWRRLLSRFRGLVRTELKHHGGREVDTAGDGFFTVFADPLPAIRAGCAIAEAVQELGLEVRVGIHAGELELEGRRVAGTNVHIAARVMALAAPAQILVTRTVRDIEHGSPVRFEDAGVHPLKGIGGEWQLFGLATVDGRPPPSPLADVVAAERRVSRAQSGRAGGRLVVVGVLAVAVIIGMTFWAIRPSVPARPPAPRQLILVSVDPTSLGKSEVSAAQADGYLPAPADVDATLVRPRNGGIELRDIRSGRLRSVVDMPSLTFTVGTAGSKWTRVGVGGGEVWIGSGVLLYGSTGWTFRSFDASTGHSRARAHAREGVISDLVYGPDGFWFLSGSADLSRLDPVTPYHVTTFPTSRWAADAQLAVPYRDGVWMIGPDRDIWFDLRTKQHQAIRLSPDESTIVEGPDAYSFERVWVLDTVDQTITPLADGREDPSGAIGVINGLEGDLADRDSFVHAAASLGGDLWIAAGSDLVGVPEDSSAPPVVVGMPRGFNADYLLTDETSGRLWVGSCYCDDWWGIHPV